MSKHLKGIPAKFDSYENLDKWLKKYQNMKMNKFNVHTSESLYKVYKNRSYVDFNPNLIYDRIKYKCSIREKHEQDSP